MKITIDDSQVVAPAERGRQKGGHRKDNDVGKDVACGNPGHFLKRGSQVARHLGQGHVDDGAVQHLHDGRRDQADENDPSILADLRARRGGVGCGLVGFPF